MNPRRNTTAAWLTVAVSAVLPGCETVEPNASDERIISRVHTLSIHVRERDRHADVMGFLGNRLQLPAIWGPEEHAGRLYAAFSAGNISLEPCGPYANTDYATDDFDAMFFGITFEPAESAAASAARMDHCGIRHGGASTFTIIKDPELCGQDLGLSLFEIKNKDKFKDRQDEATAGLRERDGGPLGILRLEEIQVGYATDDALAKWAALLAGTVRLEAQAWRPAGGPTLRLLKSDIHSVKGIVLAVTSLEKARRHLEKTSLLGAARDGELQLDTNQALGLRIILREE